MRTSPLALVTAAALALSLAACSADTNTGGKFDPSSVKKDATIAALLPPEVASAGKLVIATNASYAPAEYLDADGTTPIGYDVDLAKAIAAVLGLTPDIQQAEFASIIPAIGTKYDIGISSFTIRADRIEQVNMIAYFQAGESYAVPKGNPKNIDPADICGKTVGVESGTVEDDELTAKIDECTAAGKPAPVPLRFASQADVTTNLVGGKADLMWADSPVVSYAIAQTGGKLEQLGDVFSSAPQGIVVAKNNDALTSAVQKALQKLIDDGTYAKVLGAWGNAEGAIKTAELNPSV